MRAETDSKGVNRGGNFNNNAPNVRSANRNNNIGVRLVSTGSSPKRPVYESVSSEPPPWHRVSC